MPAIKTVIAPDLKKLRRVAFILFAAPRLMGWARGQTLHPRVKDEAVYVMGRATDNLLKQNLSNLFLAKHRTFGLKSFPLRFTDERKVHANKLSN
jgi:hypothetical protein